MIKTTSLQAKRWQLVALAGVMVLAAGLRLSALNSGLPYLLYPDEPGNILRFRQIFITGDLNPHYFYYPGLFFYLNALLYVPFYLAGHLAGKFHSPADLPRLLEVIQGVGITSSSAMVLMSRGLSAAFGLGAVWLANLTGKQVSGRVGVGLLAALFMAISLTNLDFSRYTYPHEWMVFFLLAAFLGADRILNNSSWKGYLLAGIGSGLAASCYYNAALILAAVVAAHFIRSGWKGLADRKIYATLLLAVFIFTCLNPFIFLDSSGFLHDYSFIVSHYLYAVGGTQAAGIGDTPAFYLTYNLQYEGPLVLLAVLQLAWMLVKRKPAGLVFASFLIPYVVIINIAQAHNPRTFLPVLAFLLVLSAMLLGDLLAWVRSLKRNVLLAGWAALFLACLVIPIYWSVWWSITLQTPDSRVIAPAWLADNLPAGSKIAIESYTAYLDPKKYQVDGFLRLIDHTPEWYSAVHYDYLVFSQGMFNRFFSEPDVYPAEIQAYNHLFDYFTPVKFFNDGGYELRLYRVEKRPPAP